MFSIAAHTDGYAVGRQNIYHIILHVGFPAGHLPAGKVRLHP